MSRDERTRSYVAKRTAEGKSKREIIRCLKRYVAREAYHVLVTYSAPSSPMGPQKEGTVASSCSSAA